MGGAGAITLSRVRDVVFALLDTEGHPVGCGFFVTPCGLALTVNHGFDNWSASGKVNACKLHRNSSSSSLVEVELSFSVVSTNAELDFTVLRLDGPRSEPVSHFPLPTAPLDDATMWGKAAILVHGNLALNAQFRQRPEASVVACNIATVHPQLLLYTAVTASVGDSGGALLLLDGQLVGIRKEGVNDVIEEAASPTTGRKKRRYKTLSEAASISTSAAALRLDCVEVRTAVTSAQMCDGEG